MNRATITRLSVKNFGCIKDETFELSPLHAFVGPNDSGKSTILRAVRTAMGAARLWSGRNLPADIDFSSPAELKIFVGPVPQGESFELRADASGQITHLKFAPSEHPAEGTFSFFQQPLRSLRLDPDALRSASQIFESNERVEFRDERGEGLGAVLDAIRDRDDGAYERISAKVRTLFPSVKFLQLARAGGGAKSVAIELQDGTSVQAEFMSEGLLYFLAYLAVSELAPASVLLIEEPENGLHPARIAEVVRVLRKLSETTQVLMATHSPLVINELEGHEVSVVTRRPETGTKATLLKDTPNFDERSGVYALGELWVAYANGEYEDPLFTPPEEVPDLDPAPTADKA